MGWLKRKQGMIWRATEWSVVMVALAWLLTHSSADEGQGPRYG